MGASNGDACLVAAAQRAASRCINAKRSCTGVSGGCGVYEPSSQGAKACNPRNYSYTLSELLAKQGLSIEQQALRVQSSSLKPPCCSQALRVQSSSLKPPCCSQASVVVSRKNAMFSTVAGVDASLYIENTKLREEILGTSHAGACPSQKLASEPSTVPVIGLSRVAVPPFTSAACNTAQRRL
jgi:hypothetical protein